MKIVSMKSSIFITKRPMVVLAGWLGCHPKSLKRYEQLYRELGFQLILPKIASPPMIVNTILHARNNEIELPPTGWPSYDSHIVEEGSIQSLAWDVLREIHHANSSFIIFHSFSNGGFFLWESIRQILSNYAKVDNFASEEREYNQKSVSIGQSLSTIKNNVRGLVFDSCPSSDMSRLPLALKHTSWTEMLDVIGYCGLDHMLLSHRPNILAKAQQQADFYVDSLVKSSFYVPHLFLYSRNDHLIDFNEVDRIVQNRTAIVGPDQIHSKRWEMSNHCSHFRDHPEEYYHSLKAFVETCASQKVQTRSRL